MKKLPLGIKLIAVVDYLFLFLSVCFLVTFIYFTIIHGNHANGSDSSFLLMEILVRIMMSGLIGLFAYGFFDTAKHILRLSSKAIDKQNAVNLFSLVAGAACLTLMVRLQGDHSHYIYLKFIAYSLFIFSFLSFIYLWVSSNLFDR